MSVALVSPSKAHQFYYFEDGKNNMPNPDISKLVEFVRSHLYEDGKLIEQ